MAVRCSYYGLRYVRRYSIQSNIEASFNHSNERGTYAHGIMAHSVQQKRLMGKHVYFDKLIDGRFYNEHQDKGWHKKLVNH